MCKLESISSSLQRMAAIHRKRNIFASSASELGTVGVSEIDAMQCLELLVAVAASV